MNLDIFNKFKDLSFDLENNELINVEENNVNECFELVEYFDFKDMFESISKSKGITIPQNQHKYAYLTGLRLDWVFSKNEDWLYGGYSFSLFECLNFPSHFWKIDNDPPQSLEQKAFLEDLVYFQESAHGNDGTYGCFVRNQNYDKKIVFYDNGNYFEMNIGFEEYIEAILKYKGVSAWQFFFIDPELIIKTFKGFPSEKWAVTSVDYKNSRVKNNMTDAVLFQMNKIIRLFPILFPDVDLAEAISKRDKLALLLN